MKISVLFILLNLVFADYGGGYAGSGFRYGSNAREYALAGALIADKTPGFYTFSNPALLQFTKSNIIGTSYQAMSLDRSIQSFNFVRKLPPSAGVGLAILRAGTKNIQGKNGMNQDTGSFSAQELEGIISFGVAFGKKLAVGINIKTLFSTIAKEYKGTGISSDAGIVFKLNRKLYFGAVITNLKGGYSWKYSIGGEDRSEEEELPQIISFGGVYSNRKGISFYLQEDIVNPPGRDVNYRIRFGSELTLTNGIKLRGGLKQSQGALPSDIYKDELKLKPTLGIGVPLTIWQGHYIHLDYALDPGSVGEGLSHLFSFTTTF